MREFYPNASSSKNWSIILQTRSALRFDKTVSLSCSSTVFSDQFSLMYFAFLFFSFIYLFIFLWKCLFISDLNFYLQFSFAKVWLNIGDRHRKSESYGFFLFSHGFASRKCDGGAFTTANSTRFCFRFRSSSPTD